MELNDLFLIIKKKIWVLVTIVLLTTLITAYISLSEKDKYETSFIATVQANREYTTEYQFSGYYSIQSSELFINTIVGWIKSPSFVADIYNRAEIEYDTIDLKSLGKKIYARRVPPQNISIIISDNNEERSLNIAQNTLLAIQEKANAISGATESSISFDITGLEYITIPIKTNPILNILIAVIVSTILGLFVVAAIEYFSPTINNTKRAKNIFRKYPISLKNINLKGLINPETKEAEKFRFLRANLNIGEDNEKPTMIIAGLNEASTTPTISANLALSFARSGKRTVLVDADFSNPTIHEFFGKQNEFGFSEFLFDEKNIEKYIQKTEEENLKIISAGIKLSYASDSIERSNIKNIIGEIKNDSDVVIINVPSLNISSEAFPMFLVIKKVLLVIKTGSTNIVAAKYINNFLDEKEIEKNIVII